MFVHFITFSQGFALATLSVWIEYSNVEECFLSDTPKTSGVYVRFSFVRWISLDFFRFRFRLDLDLDLDSLDLDLDSLDFFGFLLDT